MFKLKYNALYPSILSTTIKLDNKTKIKLEKMKVHPRETYNEVIQRLLSEVQEDREELSQDTIKGIEAALKDIKAGRVYSSKQVKRRLKL